MLGLGMALVLALGGVGVANLASGADHSGPGRHHAPEPPERGQPSEHGKPSMPDHAGTQHSKQMRDFAQAHREGMRAWQKCHQAGGPSCEKPAPPGWLKHPDQHPGGWPPKKGSDRDDDKDEAHGD